MSWPAHREQRVPGGPSTFQQAPAGAAGDPTHCGTDSQWAGRAQQRTPPRHLSEPRSQPGSAPDVAIRLWHHERDAEARPPPPRAARTLRVHVSISATQLNETRRPPASKCSSRRPRGGVTPGVRGHLWALWPGLGPVSRPQSFRSPGPTWQGRACVAKLRWEPVVVGLGPTTGSGCGAGDRGARGAHCMFWNRVLSWGRGCPPGDSWPRLCTFWLSQLGVGGGGNSWAGAECH